MSEMTPQQATDQDALRDAFIQELWEMRGGNDKHPDDDAFADGVLADADRLAKVAVRCAPSVAAPPREGEDVTPMDPDECTCGHDYATHVVNEGSCLYAKACACAGFDLAPAAPPRHEFECPVCGATIRARMADGSGETSTIEGMSLREAADEFERVMPTAAGHPLGRVLIDHARAAEPEGGDVAAALAWADRIRSAADDTSLSGGRSPVETALFTLADAHRAHRCSPAPSVAAPPWEDEAVHIADADLATGDVQLPPLWWRAAPPGTVRGPERDDVSASDTSTAGTDVPTSEPRRDPMSLHFVLKVNSAPIGACVIQRRDHGRDPDEDTVLTYDVEVDDLQHDTSDRTATIQHRYGDGAWVLTRKALGAVLDAVPAGDTT
jgi:hypothetical protein